MSGLRDLTLCLRQLSTDFLTRHNGRIGSTDSANTNLRLVEVAGISWTERVTCASSEVIEVWAKGDAGYSAQGYAFLEVLPVAVS